MGGVFQVVELTQGGSVTTRATPSSLLVDTIAFKGIYFGYCLKAPN